MIAIDPIATFPTATYSDGVLITALISDLILFDIVGAPIDQDVIKKDIETDLNKFHIVQRFED